MTTFNAVLFDKDGTLINFEKTWGRWLVEFTTKLADGDKQRASALMQQVGFDPGAMSFAEDSVIIAGTPEDGVEQLMPLLEDRTMEEVTRLSVALSERAQPEPLFPLAPILSELQLMGLKLGVATNDTAGGARSHMTALSVEHMFDAIIGSDSGYGGKPEPGMCLGFAKEVGVDPATIMMVGDSLHDLMAGKAAGMTAVGVTTGLASAQVLEPFADVLLPSIQELPAWISAQSQS